MLGDRALPRGCQGGPESTHEAPASRYLGSKTVKRVCPRMALVRILLPQDLRTSGPQDPSPEAQALKPQARLLLKCLCGSAGVAAQLPIGIHLLLGLGGSAQRLERGGIAQAHGRCVGAQLDGLDRHDLSRLERRERKRRRVPIGLTGRRV